MTILLLLGLLLVVVIVVRTRGRGAAEAPPTITKTPAAPAAPPIPPSLPSLASDEDEDDIDETRVGAELASDDVAGLPVPATRILYDDDAENDEPTQTKELILVAATGQSDQGKRRQRNEDSLLVRQEDALFVVADGMGGYRGGEVASALAVKTIDEAYAAQSFPGPEHESIPKRASELARAIHMANRAILTRASADRELEGMGTTLCAARFSTNKQRLYIGHVGDSRIYRLRDGTLRQMTSDHTMKELGVVGAQADHLSRALGIVPAVPIDIVLGKPRPGDTYLLCSDGLTKMVSDHGIEDALRGTSPEEAVTRLIKAANDNGGKDNVTVVIVSVRAPALETA